MIKFILGVIKRIIMAIIVLYGLNIATSNFNLIIPINMISIFLLSSLGLPGLVSLIALYFLI